MLGLCLSLHKYFIWIQKQVDYTNSFDKYPQKYDEKVYTKLPNGFDIKWEGEYLSLLNSDLYGMVQSPKQWFFIIYMGLQPHQMAPSDYDTCLFMGNHIIFVIYVDYYILFS